MAPGIIYDLGIQVVQTAEYGKARALPGTRKGFAEAAMPDQSHIIPGSLFHPALHLAS
jgi:hypothetical protein